MLDKKKIKFRRKRQVTPDKRYRYSIRKFNVGIASVAIAAFMFLGGGAVSVSASELESVVPANTITSLESGELAQPSPETPVGEEEVAETAPVSPAPSSEPAQSVPAPTPAPSSEPAQSVPAPAPAPSSEPVQSVPAPAPAPSSEPAQSVPAPAPAPSSDSQELAATDDLAAAKKVLEQVTSEAEVLSSDALRKAAKSTDDTSALQEAATATQAVIAEASKVFADENASLDDVNAQIAAIRTSVSVLATELQSFTGDADITVLLASGTPAADDAISSSDTAYIAKSEGKGLSLDNLGNDPIIALKSTSGTYTYKKFTGKPTEEQIKAAYQNKEFVDGAAYKQANGEISTAEKIYVIEEALLSVPSSIEESYDLTKFHHREHILYDAEVLKMPKTSLALGFLARPGSFSMDLRMNSSYGHVPSKDIPKENNTMLVMEPTTQIEYSELYTDENRPSWIDDTFTETITGFGYKQESRANYNFLLSHIDDYGVANKPNDLLNKPNSVLELPPGVSILFEGVDGEEVLASNAAEVDKVWKKLAVDFWDNDYNVRPDQVGILKMKFQVEKDGIVIKKENTWREVKVYPRENISELIKVKTQNTPNDFANGIVDNIDFSGLPDALKEEAIRMESTTPNVDGNLPQDNQLPNFYNPNNKNIQWIIKNDETGEFDRQNNEHNTSPIRVIPNWSKLFKGDPSKVLSSALKPMPDVEEPLTEEDKAIVTEAERALYAPYIQDIYEFWKDNMLVDRLTNYLYENNRSEGRGVSRYWETVFDPIPTPSFELTPTTLNLEVFKHESGEDTTASVTVRYRALTDQGAKTDIVLETDYLDTNKAAQNTAYTIEGKRADDDTKDEKPLTLTKDGVTYELVESETTKQVGDTLSDITGTANESGTVADKDTIITFYYKPVATGNVTIKYKALTADGSAEDTNVTLRAEVNDTVDAAVGSPWNAKETNVDHDKDAATDPIDERPATLLTAATPDKASLQYKLVSEKTTIQKTTDAAPVLVTSDTELEGQVVEGLTTITYYYKPVLGGVIVKYINEAGDEIADDYTDTDLNTHLTSPVQSYDATQTKPNSTDSEKPLTLTGKDGKSYIFKEVRAEAGDSQPSGNLKEGTTTVVYVYSEKPKGSVLVRYKALDAETGRQEDNSVTLRADYLDTPETYVDTAWSTVDKNVDHDNNPATDSIDEQPAKFENINGKDYVLVKTVTQVPGQDATSEATSGNVVEGQTVVTYFYAPVQTETATTENKGSVVIEYRRLGDRKEIASAKDDRKDVVVSTTTNTKTFYVVDGQRTYLEGGEAGVTKTVPTAADQLLYKADERGEQPPTINFQDTDAGETAEKTYHFVKHDETSADITGSVEVGTKTVVYLYSPEQSEPTSKDNTAKVTVNYYILGTSTELQPSYEDTPATKISETVSTRTYYLDADGNQVPVGDPTVVTNPVNPEVTYDTTLTKADGTAERPTTLTSGGKTYHLVETATSFTDGTGVSGTLTKDTVVNYYYAEVKEEEVSRTPITGNVLVHYKRASDKQELQGTYTDTPATPVAYTVVTRSYYEDAQGQKHQVGESRSSREAVTPIPTYTVEGTTEAPATLSYENTTYHYIGLETGSKPLTGDVVEGTTEVTLLYSPEMTVSTPSDNSAKVTVNYYILGTSTELQPSYEDTPATKISETVSTRTYYLGVDGNEVPVGDPTVVTNPVNPVVTYDTTLTKVDGTAERPTTLTSGGKTYHLVETATSFTDGTGVSGTLTKDTVVNYYYAEVKEEEVSRTPITGNVLVHYKRASDKQELQGTYTDTPATPVAYTVVTRSYYEDAQGQKHQVGESRSSREAVTPVPTYTIEGTTEAPATLRYENTTYHYIGLETGSKPLTGDVVEGTTEVTLLYSPEQSRQETSPTSGSVIVRYKLEGSETDATPDGITLRDDYPDTTDVVVKNQTKTIYFYEDANGQPQTVREEIADPVPTNERYEITATEAPEILVSDGKQYRKVRRSSVAESGLVPEGTTTITYYYAPIQGGVIVKYVNEEGAEIADQYTDTDLNTHLTDPVQSYDADGKKADGQTDEKPGELVGKDGKTYVFKEVKSGDGLSQPSGELKEGTTTVVYVYKEKDKGSVLVRYVALQEDNQTVDDTVHLADDYQDTPETYIGQDWNTTGNKTDGSLERPADFRNINGKDYLLVESKTTTTHDGQPVDNNPTSGQVQKGQTVVTYYYAPVPQGSVRIEYKALRPNGDINEDLNLRKAYFDTLNANVGTDYNASETGRVDHDDNPGTPLEDEKPSQIVLGAATYRLVEARTTKRLNDGQDSLTDLTSGQVEKGTITITYYYAPVLGQVIVKYKALNADGTAVDDSVHLADDYPEVTAGNVNDSYAITGQKPNSQEDEKPSTFVKPDKTYHLVASKTTKQVGTNPATIVGDNHDGNVAEGTTLITFFYAPEQVEKGTSRQVKGDVTIRYENTAGEEIKTSLPDTVQGLVATYTKPDRRYIKVDNQVSYLDTEAAETEVLSNLAYDADQTREDGTVEKPLIITHNDKNYHFIKLKDGSAATTGLVTEATQTVTYVYALEQTAVQEEDITGSVVVKYQKLADRSQIKADYSDTTNVKVGVKRISQNYYEDKDGVRQLVGNATEVKELLNPAPTYTVEGDTEKPAIIDVNGINYHFVGIDETKSALTGDVTEVTKEVVLLYNPEMVETTPNTRRASVYVDYKILGTNEELQARYTDTNQAVIATSETTKRYYLNQDGSETVLQNTTSPETFVDVTYDTTENNERPLTLTKAGKEYHLVAGATLGATDGTLRSDVYVTYYYAEIKTETGQTEEKGKVLIHYEDTEGNTISPEKVDVEDVLVSTAPTTRRYYEDGNGTKQYIEDLQVGTKVPTNAQYDASQVREGGVEEKPSTIIYNDKNYHFIKLKVGSASETGTVTVETQTVTYVYSPEVTVSTPSDNSAKVTVNYYILGTDETLQPSYEDTPVTKISETVSTRTYYLGADGNEVPVGDPTVVTNPVDPAVTYDTTETKNGNEERPTTLTSGDKTYHLVEAATSFTEGTGISGTLTKDTVVNYYYAEVKEEVTTVPTNGSVTIKYETVDGEELQTPFSDTPSTEISSVTTKRKYYEYNGEKTYVGEAEVTPSTTDVPYNTTENDEKPETLQKDGKTYQRVAVKAGSAAENGKVTGDHVVTYVYAE
ncbi:TPA: MucBP domain-containing protein, partial [Streptococcus suis]